MMMMNDVKAKCHAHSTINQTTNQRINKSINQTSTLKTQHSNIQNPALTITTTENPRLRHQHQRLRLRPQLSSPAVAISSSTPGLPRVLDIRRGTV
jgi:hypothetical protein